MPLTTGSVRVISRKREAIRRSRKVGRVRRGVRAEREAIYGPIGEFVSEKFTQGRG
jgi:hypothetical protein